MIRNKNNKVQLRGHALYIKNIVKEILLKKYCEIYFIKYWIKYYARKHHKNSLMLEKNGQYGQCYLNNKSNVQESDSRKIIISSIKH